MSYMIVLGNEKGGTGKSTTAMHIATALLTMDYTVGTIDVDARQGTFSRYVENRKRHQNIHRPDLRVPEHIIIRRSANEDLKAATQEDYRAFDNAVEKLSSCQFIVVDTPGHDTELARYAHSFADTLITPLNDSFIDLDVLVHVEPETLSIQKPSIYADWVFEEKKRRAMRDKGSIDWVILRNRLSTMHSKNKERMDFVLNALSKRLAFRHVRGFSERVIFKELFNHGLTLLDLKQEQQGFNMSHVAARQELRELMTQIRLPQLQESINKTFSPGAT